MNHSSTRKLQLAGLSLILAPCLALAQAPGGFVEDAGVAGMREPVDASAIVPERGRFDFPAPYGTEAVRLTNVSDCAGEDCVFPVGYSYWNNINNHAGFDTMLIFVGLDRNKGGAGPTLLQYDKRSGQVENLGPLFDDSSPYSWASGEGWYFSATLPTKLYVPSGASIFRFDVMTREFETVFDGSAHSDRYVLWQLHSSADDRVHSATVRDAQSYEMLGCMAYEEDKDKLHYFPKKGLYDECQVDKSGQWLVIKEDVDGKDGEDNRIIDLASGSERVLLDRDGAGGHSDLGHGYMIASDNWAPDANTQKLWKFDAPALEGAIVYRNGDWNVGAPAHVSHSNAKPEAPESQYSCGSSVNRVNGPAANEIICFPLDGSEDVLVVAPTMTDLDAEGGGDDYGKAPKGNLDVTGEYFVWTSNLGGGRMDLFMVRVPGHLLD